MTARDDYPVLAWFADGFRPHQPEHRAVMAALAEIDQLRLDVETLRSAYQRDLQGLRDERDALLARRDEVMEQSGDAVRDLMRRNERAMNVALQYGTIDGAFHKQWVIDQMLRALTGAHYSKFVDPGWWDEGIAP